jgi:hypothetical protein
LETTATTIVARRCVCHTRERTREINKREKQREKEPLVKRHRRPRVAPPLHLTPPLLLTADEGRAEGGGEAEVGDSGAAAVGEGR